MNPQRKAAAAALWEMRDDWKRARIIARLCNLTCSPWPPETERFLSAFAAARTRVKKYPKDGVME